MHGNSLVVDGVVHAYNNSPENWKNDLAQQLSEDIYDIYSVLSSTQFMTEAQFYREHTVEELERLLFEESDVDLAIYHAIDLSDYFKDGLVSLDKGLEFRDRNPERALLYGSVNPLAEDAVEQVERLGQRDADGLKLYPTRFRNGRHLRIALNDEDQVVPILRKATEVGIENVAVHKAVPLTPAPRQHYGVDDVADVATRFPELNFTIVHSGYSFIEDTIHLLSTYDNVYGNLETTSCLLNKQPKRFAESLGKLLLWAGPEKLIWASGTTTIHPQPLIEDFWDFEMPQELIDEYGYPEVTDEMKERILGKNALELHGIDTQELRSSVQNDQWAEANKAKPEPWSAVSEGGADD